MRWPWRKQPAPPAHEVQGESAPQAAAEVDLAALSLTDLDEWLASPFWKVLGQWLEQEIELNKEALSRGDVALTTAGQEGFLYRSDEGLRGDIIGMEFVRTLFPVQIREEIEAARQARAEED